MTKITEPWGFDLFSNQKVVEVKKAGSYEGKYFKEDFEVFRKLKRALWKRKEAGAVLALVDYIGDNSNGYTFGLSLEKFKIEYGYTKTSYHDAVKTLEFYGILEYANRFKIDPKGQTAPIYIFRGDFNPENLPKEKYNSKKK